MDENTWIANVKAALKQLASREEQQELWLWDGSPPMPRKTSSPTETMCYLSDVAFDSFLCSTSIHLTEKEKRLGHILLAQIDKYDKYDPHIVIDDPEWCEIRETARQLLESLKASRGELI